MTIHTTANGTGGWKMRAMLAGFALVLAAGPAARAQTDLDREFEFASGLVEWGFADFALTLVDTLQRANPSVADRAELIRAQALVASRKFKEAEAIVKRLGASPKADAIQISLANAYFALGETARAEAIYKAFFAKYPRRPDDPDVVRFYRDAAYRLGMMMDQAGDLDAAIESYERVLRTRPDREIERRVKSDLAKVYVRKARADAAKKNEYLTRAEQLANEVQNGGVDAWFGHAIVTLANVHLLRGDEARARKMLQDYRSLFADIDEALRSQNVSLGLSPVAGARYLLGELYQRQAASQAKSNQRDEAVRTYGRALQEYYNVFVRYGDSDTGPRAGLKAKEVQEILEKDFGKTVQIDLGDLAAKAVQTQFRLADNLYRQDKFAEAAAEYIRVLNEYPETDRSVEALINLARSYESMGDTLMMETVARYLAERFHGSDTAALGLLTLGKAYVDRKNEVLSRTLYDLYLENFPTHDKAGAILFYLASRSQQAGDEALAASYFDRLLTDYPDDPFYARALSQVAFSYLNAGEFAKAAEAFQTVVNDTPPNPQRAIAQYNYADALMRQGNHREAAAALGQVIQWLTEQADAYAISAADRDTNRTTLQKALYQLGTCFAKITEPAEAVPDLRDRAIKTYQRFLADYPDADLAPRAMSGMGTVLLERERFDEAAKIFDDLAVRYPDSPEGKNALFSLARSAFEIGKVDQAVAAFEKMLSQAAQYSPAEFLRIGQLMMESGQADEAIRAFRQVGDDAERGLVERSLFGIAEAHYTAGRHDEAIAAVDALLAKYPNSALFFDAKFLVGEAHREAGRYPEAVAALADVFNYGRDQEQLDRATFALAGVQRQAGDLTAALASYQRLALLSDPAKPELRDKIRESIFASIEIARELARWQDVADACDQYTKLFPLGDRADDVRQIRRDAMLKLAAGGGA